MILVWQRREASVHEDVCLARDDVDGILIFSKTFVERNPVEVMDTSVVSAGWMIGVVGGADV